MSSTNKTTNYELSQFVETDRPAWLTDYNGDMRTIDSTMKAISDVASGASGSISELADRMSTAEGNISTNTNDITALDARADALEAGAQSTAGTIANIQTEQTAQNMGIEAATELGYNLARPYDSASTYKVGAFVLFQNTLYKCITHVVTGEAFDPSKWLAVKATDFNTPISIDGASEIYSSYDDVNFRHYHPIITTVGCIAHFMYHILQVTNEAGISRNTSYTLGTLKPPYRPFTSFYMPLTAATNHFMTAVDTIGMGCIGSDGSVQVSFNTDLPRNSLIAFNTCYACSLSI